MDTGRRFKVKLQRVQIYLTDKQIERLDEKVEKSGLSRSEIIRRIIDEKLKKEKLENGEDGLKNNG